MGRDLTQLIEKMRRARPYLRKLFSLAGDLSDAELLILSLLVLSPKERVPMTILYDELSPIKPSKLTQITNKMEDKGLIKKVRSKSDRRKVEIVMTEKGKKVYKKFEESIAEMLQPLVEDLPSEEFEVLEHSFDIWVKVLSKL